MKDFQLKVLTGLDQLQQQALLELFAEADFIDSGEDATFLNAAVAGSLLAVGAFSADNQLIGFARALGDGVSDCYIQDVVVRRDFRGQHIGQALVNFLVGQLQNRGVDWIGLVATPGNAGFYRQLGFEPLENHTPMIFRQFPADQQKKI